MSDSPFKLVEGKFPKYPELLTWSEEKWIMYIRFLETFIYQTEKGESWKINSDMIKDMEANLKMPDHPWEEFIWRTGKWAKDTTPAGYRLKVNAMSMYCFTYLKKHPSLVTEKMRELFLKHPQRMGWCLNQFKIVEDANGGDIIRRDNDVVDDNAIGKQVNMPSLQVKMMTSMAKIVDITEMLANSVDARGIKDMDTKDKISALAKMFPMLAAIGKGKVAPTHFTQININGSTKELEKQMFDFTKKTQ